MGFMEVIIIVPLYLKTKKVIVKSPKIRKTQPRIVKRFKRLVKLKLTYRMHECLGNYFISNDIYCDIRILLKTLF